MARTTTRNRWSRLTKVGCVAAALAAGVAQAQNNVPFSETYRRPAVSPYTMLATPSFMAGSAGAGGGAVGASFNPLVYQQLIQPREEQERGIVSQMQQQRQLNGIRNQVQSIQRDTTARQVNEQIRPTGHAATYLNTSHYYGGR